MSDTHSTSPSIAPPSQTIRKKFRHHTLVIGVLLLLLGLVGFFLPGLIALTTDAMIAGLLIAGGLVWGMHSLGSDPGNFSNWLKTIVLVGTGLLMALFPATSIQALALWLAAYLLLDMVGSFILAFSSRPGNAWLWMLFNGMVSLLLAGLILTNWPEISFWIVGIYVSISLVFDGVALLAIYFVAKKNPELLETIRKETLP